MIPLKTRLKIRSVNNLTDGRYFAAMGAEWMGFGFDSNNPRNIDVAQAKEISEWLAGPRFVGEFDEMDVTQINSVLTELNFTTIETSIDLDLNQLDKKVESIIHRIPIHSNSKAIDLENFVEERSRWTSQFLLDFHFDWEMIKKHSSIHPTFLKEFCEEYPCFIRLNFAKNNLIEIIEEVIPFGIEISGGNEIQTGMQSFEEVGELLELLEA